MVSKIALMGILFPIVIYICLAAIFLFILGCAVYVCAANCRQCIQKIYQKVRNPFRQYQLSLTTDISNSSNSSTVQNRPSTSSVYLLRSE